MTVGSRAARVVAPLVVAAITVVLARRAMLPGLGFWDTGEFQAVGPLLGTAAITPPEGHGARRAFRTRMREAPLPSLTS